MAERSAGVGEGDGEGEGVTLGVGVAAGCAEGDSEGAADCTTLPCGGAVTGSLPPIDRVMMSVPTMISSTSKMPIAAKPSGRMT